MNVQNPDILIRPATKRDLADLTRLSEQLGYPATRAEMAQRLDDLLYRESHIVLVAQNPQGVVIGWLHGFIRRLLMTDAHIEVGGLIIDEGYRGQGIGNKLISACESWAYDKAIDTILVRSNIVREDAHRFYHRIGYQTLKTSLIFKKELAP